MRRGAGRGAASEEPRGAGPRGVGRRVHSGWVRGWSLWRGRRGRGRGNTEGGEGQGREGVGVAADWRKLERRWSFS